MKKKRKIIIVLVVILILIMSARSRSGQNDVNPGTERVSSTDTVEKQESAENDASTEITKDQTTAEANVETFQAKTDENDSAEEDKSFSDSVTPDFKEKPSLTDTLIS